MKCLLIIFFASVLSIISLDNQVDIALTKSEVERNIDRSISIELSASHNDNTICIYSNILLDELQATIKNAIGDILTSKVISVFPNQAFTFSIENIENGIYILELNDGKNEYQGYFEITHNSPEYI